MTDETNPAGAGDAAGVPGGSGVGSDAPADKLGYLTPGAYKVVAEFMLAEQAMHKMYSTTAVCYGGAGGRMLTMHCVHGCINPDAHHAERQRYQAALTAVHKLLASHIVQEARDGAD